MNNYPTNDPVKVCVRCIYSVFVGERWLCVKHGCTISVRDYCKEFKRRVDKDVKKDSKKDNR